MQKIKIIGETIWMVLVTLLYLCGVVVLGLHCLIFSKNDIYSRKKVPTFWAINKWRGEGNYIKSQEKSPNNLKLKIYEKSPDFSRTQISHTASFFCDKNPLLRDFCAFLCDNKDFIPIRWILIY